MPNVTIISPAGDVVDVPEAMLPDYAARGYRVEGANEQGARIAAEHRTDEYGGPVGKFSAAGLGALRTVTGGISDLALRELGGGEQLRGLKEENPLSSTAGEIAGAFIPTGLSGVAGAAGATIRGGEGLGLGSSLLRGLAAGSAEGAIYGAGQGLSEAALSEDPLTAERLISSVGSGALFGGVVGGGVGLAGATVEHALSKAKGAIDGALERSAAKALTPAEAIATGDLELLDKRTLDLAEKDEISRIRTEQAPQRKALVDELDNYRNMIRDDGDLRGAIYRIGDKDLTEAGSSFSRSNIRLRGMLDDRVSLAENPETIRPSLRKQAQSLEEIADYARGAKVEWERDVAAAPDRIRQLVRDGGVPGELGPFTPAGLDLATERELKNLQGFEWGGAIKDGLKEPAIVRMQPEFQRILEQNRKFQATLDELAKPPVSDRLTKIAEAREALSAPAAQSIGASLLHALPFGGQLATIAELGQKTASGLRGTISKATRRTAEAASTFLGHAGAAVEHVPALATKTLATVRYASHAVSPPSEGKQTLAELYKQRTDEIKSQTAYDETGTPRLRPDARASMAETLKPLRASHPLLADKMETSATRRIEYLSSLIPRRPDFGTPQIGLDHWQPSEMAMRSWARSAAAVEDPDGVEARIAHGTATHEDAAAYWAVYPERAQHYKTSILQGLPTVPGILPYRKKLALSIFTGAPIDPSMHPRVIAMLQGQFPAEPGSNGGTQSPRAAPQFGSIKKQTGTPSQERMK